MAINCIISVECAVEYQSKFLMITRPLGKHAGGMLAFPGGGVEVADASAGDLLMHAAKREVQEEVGLVLLDPLHYVTSSYFILNNSDQSAINVVFYCKLINTEIKLKISEREVPEYAWLNKNEILAAPNCPAWVSTRLFELFHAV